MKTFFLISSILLSMLSYAQSQGSISGKISDLEMNGEPLLFANIELKETQWSTQTNLNGNFEMNGIVPGAYVLFIGFPGYETLEVPVTIKKDAMVEIQKSLFAKSVDVSSILSTEKVSGTKTAALTSLRSR